MEDYKAQIIDLDYFMDENEPVLRLFCKSEGGDNLIALYRGFYPYFYVIPDPGREGELEDDLKCLSFEENDKEIEVTEVEKKRKKDGKRYIDAFKVFTNDPSDIPKIKDEVKKWDSVEGKREFDLAPPFYKRFLIDKGIRPLSWIQLKGKKQENKWNEDICLAVEGIEEVDKDEKIPFKKMAFDIETYQGEIIMLSLYSDEIRKVYATEDFEDKPGFLEVFESEKELLESFIDLVGKESVDILYGYNTDDFDFEVLRDRAETHNIELNLGRDNSRMVFVKRGRTSSAYLKGRVHIDIYRFVENILARSLKSETLTLENVAGEILGEKKVDMGWEDIKKAWREKEELKKLSEYSLKDSKITYMLGENIISQIFSISRLTGQLPFDVTRFTYGQLVENYLIREAFRRDILAPNRPKRSVINKRRSETPFQGGFVYEPEEGIYENIALFDFRSLYPSIALSYNISPDTWDVEGCEDKHLVEVKGNKYEFCQEEIGFIPDVLRKLLKERYKLKKEMKDLEEGTEEYKEVYARQYGLKILANSHYGYTGYSGAKWYCRACAESITALGREHIHKAIEKAEEMGFEVIYSDTDSVFLSSEDIKEKLREFQEEINSELPDFMEIELEDFYERGIFTATKKGKGAKKRYALRNKDGKIKITGFEKVRRDWSKLAKETQEKVIKKILDGKEKDAVKEVKETIKRLREGEVPLKDLVIYTRLKKPPEEYETTSPHVEAAKKAIQRGIEIEPGDTIGYVITEGGGGISERAEILKFADDYDPNYYIENQIIPAAIRVLKVLDYEKEDFLMKGRQSGLGSFT